MQLIERLDLTALAALNRALRKTGLEAKMVGAADDALTLRITLAPPPPAPRVRPAASNTAPASGPSTALEPAAASLLPPPPPGGNGFDPTLSTV